MTSTQLIRSSSLFDGKQFLGARDIEIVDGMVVDVSAVRANVVPDIYLDKGVLAPGLVEIQLNGFDGVNFSDTTAQDLCRALDALVLTGVTSCFPTVTSRDWTSMISALSTIRQVILEGSSQGARAVGMHCEGPFISARRRGAHDYSALLSPDDSYVDELIETTRDTKTIVTIAPELPGAQSAIHKLAAAGIVVSLGHSDADAQVAQEGIDNGATLVTHLFNAQAQLHHRAPGLAGVALDDPRVMVGLVGDGEHIDPIVERITFAAAGDRVISTTDATWVASVGGTLPAPRAGDGVLAGSAATADGVVRHLIGVGIEADAVLRSFTANPAEAMGLTDVGRISPGFRADMVWFDDWHLKRVWRDGVQSQLP